MRSNTLVSPSARTCSIIVVTEPWALSIVPPPVARSLARGSVSAVVGDAVGCESRQPWMSCGRHLTQAQRLSPLCRQGNRTASFSVRPQLKQLWAIVWPSLAFMRSAAASSSNVGGLALLDRQGAFGTHGEAEAGAVAELLFDHVRLAVDDLDGALGARRHAQAAAGALLFIDPHDAADRHRTLLSFVSAGRRRLVRLRRCGFSKDPAAGGAPEENPTLTLLTLPGGNGGVI